VLRGEPHRRRLDDVAGLEDLRVSSTVGTATEAPRCGRSSTMWSWASRWSTLRTIVRLTPKISHNDDSGSLVPGASRCCMTPSNTDR
jgi:hypothetical protein